LQALIPLPGGLAAAQVPHGLVVRQQRADLAGEGLADAGQAAAHVLVHGGFGQPAGLGRLAEVLPVALSDGLSLLLFGGGLAASVVILWKKRGEIAAYRAQEWIDRRCIKCLLTNSGFIVFALFMCVSMVLWMLA
jgi:hypothetical protein